MGTLYLVATPIGNLEDMSGRAVRILQSVDLIAAEDTRHTGRLLAHFNIRTPLTSYHEHNETARIPQILAALETGDVALVSDAGTPGLNDPGFELVRAAIDAGHAVSPIPGPNAPLAALVASGLPCDAFLYLGYLPRKKSARRQQLAAVASQPYTLIFLEAPQRLVAALQDMQAELGNRAIAIARELTKLHEEFVRGSIAEVLAHFEQTVPRGELTLVVAGRRDEADTWTSQQVDQVLQEQLKLGAFSDSQLARQVAQESGWKKGLVYQRLIHIKTGKTG